MFKTTLTVLQPIEDRVKECELAMTEYTNLFFKQDNDPFIPMKPVVRSFSVSLDGKKRHFDFLIVGDILIVEIEKLDPNSELNAILKRRKQIFLTLTSDENEKERKTIENLHYKPFDPDAYNDWVAETTVEVIDIIDKVTVAQKFKVSNHFMKFFNHKISFLINLGKF